MLTFFFPKRKIQTGYKSDSSVCSAHSVTKTVFIEGGLWSPRRKRKWSQGKEGRGSPLVELQPLFLRTETNKTCPVSLVKTRALKMNHTQAQLRATFQGLGFGMAQVNSWEVFPKRCLDAPVFPVSLWRMNSQKICWIQRRHFIRVCLCPLPQYGFQKYLSIVHTRFREQVIVASLLPFSVLGVLQQDANGLCPVWDGRTRSCWSWRSKALGRNRNYLYCLKEFRGVK